MKQIGILLTSLPLTINSCLHRPTEDLHITRYDGQVEGVAYNATTEADSYIRSRANIEVLNGNFVSVKLEMDQKINNQWVVYASWDPKYDNLGVPLLHADAAARYAGQIEPATYNTDAAAWIDAGNEPSGFYTGTNSVHQSMFNFVPMDEDLYFYQIQRYALFVRSNVLYASIIGTDTSRQTFEAMLDLTPYLDAESKILDDIKIGDVFDWRLNGEQQSFGYLGDVESSPFSELNGSITNNGIFRDISDDTLLDQFFGMLDLYDGETGTIHDTEMYGRHSLGGWVGNYQAVDDYFSGKDVTSYASLWDRLNIGDLDPGEDEIKDINNGIAGATVGMTRENGAFQDALIKLGLDIQRDGIKWN